MTIEQETLLEKGVPNLRHIIIILPKDIIIYLRVNRVYFEIICNSVNFADNHQSFFEDLDLFQLLIYYHLLILCYIFSAFA